MAIGASAYSLAYFHLLSHAFFKALLFLGSGSVIHSMSDEQDIKKMGGLYNKIPLTYITMLIGSFSLIGLPFFSGYYSKDLILEILFLDNSKFGFYIFVIGLVGVLFTSIYSFRLLLYVFHGESNADEKSFSSYSRISTNNADPTYNTFYFLQFFLECSHILFSQK